MFDDVSAIILTDPKFTEFLLISHFFGIGSASFYFHLLKLSMQRTIKNAKKERRQTFRPHMGALFSAINLKINSKFS